MTEQVVLDWHRHEVGARPGTCRCCGGRALLRDGRGRPCHKVCAEREATEAAARAATAYATTTTT